MAEVKPAEPFAVKGPPAEGFTLLYNGIAKRLLGEHSAVLRCYLILCVYSNEHRETHPSIATLAEDMGMSESSVIRATQRLEEIGVVRIVRPETVGRGRANTYYLVSPKTCHP